MALLAAYSDEQLAGLSAPELWRLLISNEDRVPRNVINECASRGDPILDHIEHLRSKKLSLMPSGSSVA